jgi:hypothetical protein
VKPVFTNILPCLFRDLKSSEDRSSRPNVEIPMNRKLTVTLESGKKVCKGEDVFSEDGEPCRTLKLVGPSHNIFTTVYRYPDLYKVVSVGNR